MSYVVDGVGEFDSLNAAVVAARPATSLVAAMRRPHPQHLRRRRAFGEAAALVPASPAALSPAPAAPQPITFNQALVLTGIVLFGLWALGAFDKGKA